ncbi:hypothetical protein SERLA73DRAFT_74568 [Serpula lacrymans var. lacrymans S7.3]|uniref:Uncharacterized protein n=1 Tax=Serpula lacrymans var. lacrymans (strain S7.3) TaxID=936435 RepID=F8PZM0_SERL3|nr:hypothetical protein SERLA73DRAFT_74568 [Serpula lacrymans var. lacrymans S7.3]
MSTSALATTWQPYLHVLLPIESRYRAMNKFNICILTVIYPGCRFSLAYILSHVADRRGRHRISCFLHASVTAARARCRRAAAHALMNRRPNPPARFPPPDFTVLRDGCSILTPLRCSPALLDLRAHPRPRYRVPGD